ncbi:hypothetical protein F5X96DRAFT_658380 [Biscogniauxia mediterranea]|nr:hypothetical protein F5X96DRAFT_658380 [Biscogniauxia mediterranea]
MPKMILKSSILVLGSSLSAWETIPYIRHVSKMAQPQDNNQRVYLACRAIFTGPRALLRKQKKVREEVQRNSRALAPLTNELGVERVVQILRGLLERRIFENELRAKVVFPDLFRPLPDQEVRREASEVEAAKTTAEALEEIASVNYAEAEIDNEVDNEVNNEIDDEGAKCTPDLDEMEGGSPIQVELVHESVQETCSEQKPNDEEKNTKALPSLYPILIPYNVQHLILNEAQRLLEESCFQFAQTWFPSVLKKRGWNYASSLELTRWTQVIANEANYIPTGAFKMGEEKLNEVLSATHTLRHSAVHRLPTTARGITDMVKSGVAMASVLGDVKRAAQLEVMCDEVASKAKTFEVYKNALENVTKRKLDCIQRQREELDQQEKDVVQGMLKDDAEYKVLMGDLLEEAIAGILRENREGERTEDVAAVKDEQWQSAQE